MAAAAVSPASAVFAQNDMLFVSALCQAAAYGTHAVSLYYMRAAYLNIINVFSVFSSAIYRLYSYKKKASFAKIECDSVENYHSVDNTQHAALNCPSHRASSVL